MRAPQVSVRTLLVAVAVVALLIPFPWEALALSFVTTAHWIVLPVLVVLLCDSFGKGRAGLIAMVIIVGAGSYFLPNYPYAWTQPIRIVLTPINLIGPIHAARRCWRGEPLTSGEILWAWMGLVWVAMLTLIIPMSWRMHGGGIDSLEMKVEFARLTVVLALLLAFYGKRPIRPVPVWPHHFGWAVAECDVIAWAWYAVS